ncbi:histidine phosphatase family protein [Arthrobacter sp. H14]|uniref:histidine phosphatase family protein n=1 Tax=Arthrobacter sp. H14 TaxID=1312959 RepID=UPI00047D573A|nr:histidine phosphatase family protein [Arthrobacter sp. H14]
MSRAIVHMLRHGEVHNPDRLLYGRLPEFHLSELGRKMAERAADEFKKRADAGSDIVYIVSSPLTRAQETAAPTAEMLGLGVVTDDRIIEAKNRFEGIAVTRAELRHTKHWRHLVNPMKPSWGEPYKDQVERVMEAVEEARARAVELGGDGAEAVMVSHQLPIWVTRRAAEKRRLWHDPRRRTCALASITSLTFDDETIVDVDYSEPAADLLPGAANIPGA